MGVEWQPLPRGTRKCKACRQVPQMILILGTSPEYEVRCPNCQIQGPRAPDSNRAVTGWNNMQKRKP
jgi:hypothetical protein